MARTKGGAASTPVEEYKQPGTVPSPFYESLHASGQSTYSTGAERERELERRARKRQLRVPYPYIPPSPKKEPFKLDYCVIS